MSRSSRGTCAVGVAVLLTLTSCGTRASDSLRQQAAAAALGSGGGSGSTGTGSGGSTGSDSLGTTGTGSTSGTGSSGAGSTATGGSTGGKATGGGSTGSSSGTGRAGTGGSSGSGSTGGSGAAPAPAGGNGGATDVGVTDTALTVANVSDVGGPRPGLFAGAPVGTAAYFNMINSQGGIYGRKINVLSLDSQLDCGQNTDKTTSAVNKAFAFVGSFSLYDDCGADVLKKHLDIPDVHAALGLSAQKLPTNFPIAPLGNGWRTGPLDYYKAKFGTKWSHIGAIYAGVGTGPSIWDGVVAAVKNSGGNFDRTESYGATDTDFTGAVVRMQSAGVKMIYVNTTDGPTGAALVRAIKSQNLDWPIIFGATAYAPDFLSNLTTAQSEGVLNDQQFAQFFNTDEAQVTPSVGLFQKWMALTNKKQQLDIFAAYGWAEAQLFTQALKAAGPKATRASILTALRQIKKFDADGLFATANPADHVPATCWLENTIKGGKFVRVDPAKGFRCDGTYFRRAG